MLENDKHGRLLYCENTAVFFWHRCILWVKKGYDIIYKVRKRYQPSKQYQEINLPD